ncbi:DNA topology modulation protein [Virgibacillus dakarensis]|nr:DNA topology modulation protein [Virgibacillus dakarensis]
MKKIMIVGSGGAGKSTLAKQLGEKLDIPVYHLDAIFWQPGWRPIERQALVQAQQHIINRDTWIIDGNYSSTMDIRLKHADTVIFLHYSTIRCLYGIVKRRIQYHKKTRPDIGKDCPEKLDLEFVQWVYQFNKSKAPIIHQKLNQQRDTTIHIFNRPKQTKNFLENVN